MALTIMSASLYADNTKPVAKKAKTECCSRGCCDECSNGSSKVVYAAKRGLVINNIGGGCTCC